MNYTKEEVMKAVQELLGDNPQGLYIDYPSLEDRTTNSFLCSSIEPAFYTSELDDYDLKCGASKLCIIPKNTHKDYVIKIPFTGVWDEPLDENGDYYEDGIDRPPVLVGKFNIDYIYEEMDIYNVVSPETRKILAKNEYVGDYCGIPIYVQERANKVYACSNRVEGYLPKIALNLYKELEELAGNFYQNFIIDLLTRFGYTAVLNILDDLYTYTGDFHDENYGYTRYDAPIIIDYGGYDSGSIHYFEE